MDVYSYLQKVFHLRYGDIPLVSPNYHWQSNHTDAIVYDEQCLHRVLVLLMSRPLWPYSCSIS